MAPGSYDNFLIQETSPDRVKLRHGYKPGMGSDNLAPSKGGTRYTVEFVMDNLTIK